MSFTKLLVANRGEIACRVLRSARALGYHTVAVYSEADARAPHVALADQAVAIGAGPAGESYLRVDAILAAATRSGADAVHPGYGFLSENAAFAEACAQAGLTFVGPPAEAIRAMGDKALAKQRMERAGVPLVPGFWESDDHEALQAAAARVGFPLLVKATAGGGGRGIRVVRSAAELGAAIDSARAEAESAFGSARVMLERYVERARHIELQVFADAHGHVIHLGERDCTAQRRRQKVIEEAPCPSIDAALRARMGEAAVAAARAVDYRGAGTVEFIVDERNEPYFLEMNTRIQVEHPVTELVTGLDLVALQLRVAAGEPLSITQADVQLRGHAVEARLYAEDPYDDFRPQVGRITRFQPELAERIQGVRIDAGVTSASDVTPFYDAMLAKVIVHAPTRAEALRKLTRALEDAPVFGVRTNARFLQELVRTSDFREARLHTGSLDAWQAAGHALFQRPALEPSDWALAFALVVHAGSAAALRSAATASTDVRLRCLDDERTARVLRERDTFQVTLAGVLHTLTLQDVRDDQAIVEREGLRAHAYFLRAPGELQLVVDGDVRVFSEPSPLRGAREERDPRMLRAPLSGTLRRVLVSAGARVVAGQTLLLVEAMKMEVKVLATRSGSVQRLLRHEGEQVELGELLVELAPDEEP